MNFLWKAWFFIYDFYYNYTGWNDVGWHNPDIITPTMDALVKDGVELDQFYAAPVCTP